MDNKHSDPVIEQLRTTLSLENIDDLEGELITSFFRVLSNIDRLKIIKLLLIKPHYMYEIKDVLNISQSNLSQQIDKLQYAGLVHVKKEGRNVLCSIDLAKVKKSHEIINKFLEAKTKEIINSSNELKSAIEIKEELEKL